MNRIRQKFKKKNYRFFLLLSTILCVQCTYTIITIDIDHFYDDKF